LETASQDPLLQGHLATLQGALSQARFPGQQGLGFLTNCLLRRLVQTAMIESEDIVVKDLQGVLQAALVIALSKFHGEAMEAFKGEPLDLPFQLPVLPLHE
jgi:hypothetical protein